MDRDKKVHSNWRRIIILEIVHFTPYQMRALIICFASVCINSSLTAQELPEILKTQQYKRGIYKDFGEFLKNAPSITDKFIIDSESSDKKIEKGSAVYHLTMLDSIYTRKNMKKFWGVCDGTQIFVNEANYFEASSLPLVLSIKFRKILSLGRYCYNRGTIPREKSAPVGVSGGGVTGSVSLFTTGIYVLNINNGKFFFLDKSIIRTILKKDKELSNAYKLERGKGSDGVLLKYIDAYNVKHKNDANMILQDTIKVVLYRKDKQERNESLHIALDDSSAVHDLKRNCLYKYGTKERVVKICLNSNCNELILDKKVINYFECSWDVKSKVPKLKRIDADAGRYNVYKIEEEDKKITPHSTQSEK